MDIMFGLMNPVLPDATSAWLFTWLEFGNRWVMNFDSFGAAIGFSSRHLSSVLKISQHRLLLIYL